MTDKEELKKYKRMRCVVNAVYYELEDGKRMLRAIQPYSSKKVVWIPEGIDVEIVTPEGKIAEGKVDSASIEDDNVGFADLKPEVRAMLDSLATKSEVEASVKIAPLSEVDKLFPGIDIDE